MQSPSTPPRGRLRTPPTPLHGPSNDDFVPYSPRRSSRKTLHSNPYSSSNTFVGKLASTATPAKKPALGLGYAPSDCFSSPPASPVHSAVEMRQHSLMTPRRIDNDKRNNSATGDNMLLDPSSVVRNPFMLPTPTKTPTMTPSRKRARAASLQESARVLHFHPLDPNDNMPTRHESRSSARSSRFRDSEMDSDIVAGSSRNDNGNFEIYTESHARVPCLDTSEDNPFFRPRANTIPQTTCESPPLIRKKTMSRVQEESAMQDAAARNQGLVYTFRGRKVFKKYDDSDDNDADTESDVRDPGATLSQRALKRSAGAAAQRPLTRSQVKPRLLFPPDPQPLHSYTDEEAETDIEAPTDELEQRSDSMHDPVAFSMPTTPARVKSVSSSQLASPPTKTRAHRKHDANDWSVSQDAFVGSETATSLPTPAQSSKKKRQVGFADMPVYQDLQEPVPVTHPALPSSRRSCKKSSIRNDGHLTPVVEDDSEHDDTIASGSSIEGPRSTTRSPFDQWPRTKGGLKRGGDTLPTSDSKRARSAAAAADV